jgi:hypothetical protein
MLGRVAATIALVALMGCAGLEPAGRTAQREEAGMARPAPVTPPPSTTLPPPTHTTTAPAYSQPAPAPPPPQSAPAQTQAQTAEPQVAAPNVAVATPPPPPPPRDPGDVVVHGSVPEQQVEPPNGDPRSIAERREDIRNWDHCVMQVMARQGDPNQVETDSPEDICSRQLGQSSRNAVPQSRMQRPRL